MNGVGPNTEHTASKGGASKLALGELVSRAPTTDAPASFEQMLDRKNQYVEVTEAVDLPSGTNITMADAALTEGLADFAQHSGAEPLTELDVAELNADPNALTKADAEALPKAGDTLAAPQIDPLAGLATSAAVDQNVEVATTASPPKSNLPPVTPDLAAKPAVQPAIAQPAGDLAGDADQNQNPKPSLPLETLIASGEAEVEEAEAQEQLAKLTKMDPVTAKAMLAGGIAESTDQTAAPAVLKALPTAQPNVAEGAPPDAELVAPKLAELKTLPLEPSARVAENPALADGTDQGKPIITRLDVSTAIPAPMAATIVAQANAQSAQKGAEKVSAFETEVPFDVMNIKFTIDGELVKDGGVAPEVEPKQPAQITGLAPSVLEMKGREMLQASEAQPDATPNASKDILSRAALALNMRDAQWGQRLVTQIEKMHSEGIARYEISLRPKNLGDMQVSLEVSGDDTRVNIVTETTAASRVLVGAEDRLTQMLDAAGFRLSSLSASMGSGSQFGNGKGNPSKNKQNDIAGTSKAREAGANEAAQVRVQSSQTSAVNVLA